MSTEKSSSRSRLPGPGRLRALLACGALVALAAATPVLGAEDVGTLEGKVAEAQEQAQSLATQITENESAIAAAQAEAQAAAARAAELASLLAEGRAREAELEQEIVAATEHLKETRERFRRAQDALAARLVAIYKGGMPDMTTLLLEAEGFEDLLSRAEYLKAIEDADAALAERVRELRAQIAEDLAEIEESEAAQAAHNEELAAAHAEISAAQAAAEARAGELAAIVADQQSLIGTLQSSVEEWKDEIVRLEKISEQEATQQIATWVGDWAIPESIVLCESGGNYSAVNDSSGAGGAYQILPSTWELYGGEGDPEDASPAEQDAIAAQIWADSGGSAWVCAG